MNMCPHHPVETSDPRPLSSPVLQLFSPSHSDPTCHRPRPCSAVHLPLEAPPTSAAPPLQGPASSRITQDPPPLPVGTAAVLPRAPPPARLSDLYFSVPLAPPRPAPRPQPSPGPAPDAHGPRPSLTSSWKRLWRLRKLRSLLCFSSCCSSSEGGSK